MATTSQTSIPNQGGGWVLRAARQLRNPKIATDNNAGIAGLKSDTCISLHPGHSCFQMCAIFRAHLPS
ncbi:hypothetical protein GGH92_004586, partial [Coemansia sp. RSA 2673]